MVYHLKNTSGQPISYLCLTFIFLASFGWATLSFAQNETQNAVGRQLFGQPSVLSAETAYQHDHSESQMDALRKQKSVVNKTQAAADETQKNQSAEGGAKIQSTTGTWMQGGHSGAWFNQNENGHGLFLEVLPSAPGSSTKRLLATWFAFMNGRQVWVQGLGDVVQEGNRQVARMDAYIYSGGDFTPFFNAGSVNQDFWGTMTLYFNGCNNAELSWSTSYPGYSSGQLPLERLTVIDGSSCNPDLGGDSGGGSTDDYGDTWQTGGNWSSNGVAGNLETTSDIDVFTSPTLNCNAPCTLRLKIWTTGSTDTTGELFRLSNNTETSLEYDDDDGSGLNFLIDREISPGSRFTIHVEGFETGHYTLWYETTAENQQQLTRVDFENGLLKDIRVLKNGVSLGVVPALETRGDNYPVSVGDQFSWEVIQDFGDSMSGIYSTVTSADLSGVTYLINNIIGSDHYFIPYITNETSSDRLLGVNMGLEAENRCNCIIQANTPNVVAGYFELYSNSNLRLYEGNTYTSGYYYWEDFADNAGTDTGRINFTLNP